MELKDKVVVITGSSSGIGEATARLFAKEGAKIVINSNSNTEGGEKAASEINAAGGRAVYFKADVSVPNEANALIKEAISKFGAIDILINNAGAYESQDFINSSKESWDRVFNNNLFGAVFCSQSAAKEMLNGNGGKILNTASVYGLEHTGDPNGMAYSIAKAGVISLTKNLAKLWSPKILVNAVAPGYVQIPRFNTFPESEQKAMINEMRLGRFIKPEEIAEAFLYLAKSDAVTGEVLVVDGGFGLK
ncbi:MAG: SDR family oxidoreductase [Patescibacteria group bacterium]|nr:SDR family oxidoreductase [Patescibacteria group bacterium]